MGCYDDSLSSLFDSDLTENEELDVEEIDGDHDTFEEVCSFLFFNRVST